MTVTSDMVNGHGMCHGGLIFTLADTAFACACNSWGPVTVAAGCDITFVAPARTGDVLTAAARARARYGRHGIYDVTVSRGDLLVAEFRGRSQETRPLPPQRSGPDGGAELPAHPQAPERDRAHRVGQRLR